VNRPGGVFAADGSFLHAFCRQGSHSSLPDGVVARGEFREIASYKQQESGPNPKNSARRRAFSPNSP